MNDEEKLKLLIKEWINQITDKDLLLNIYSCLLYTSSWVSPKGTMEPSAISMVTEAPWGS